jgi:hypothetical protein
MNGLNTHYTLPVQEDGKEETKNEDNTDMQENSDLLPQTNESETEDKDPLAGKYFPPIYEATETIIPPLTNSSHPEKLKKSTLQFNLFSFLPSLISSPLYSTLTLSPFR